MKSPSRELLMVVTLLTAACGPPNLAGRCTGTLESKEFDGAIDELSSLEVNFHETWHRQEALTHLYYGDGALRFFVVIPLTDDSELKARGTLADGEDQMGKTSVMVSGAPLDIDQLHGGHVHLDDWSNTLDVSADGNHIDGSMEIQYTTGDTLNCSFVVAGGHTRVE
jgi:hypothetical protein